MRPLTVRRVLWTCAALAAVLLACVVLALKLGAVPISVTDLVWNLARVAIGRSDQLPSEYRLIVFDLRLPRIMLGILVGAALSVSGASFQALLRNPLADPFVLGVSSGAALGSILALIFAPQLPFVMPLGAFLGAMATIAAVFFLGRRDGELDSTTLLLGGVISASFLSAIIMFLMTTLAGRDLRGAVFWMMGDLSTPVPVSLQWIFTAGLIVGIVAIYSTAADLNLLLTGEREAIHLGVQVTRVAAHRAGRFRQRTDRLRRFACAPRSAADFRFGLPDSDSGFGLLRSDRDSARRYAGAHGGRADGVAGGRDDGHGGRAGIHLFAATGDAVSVEYRTFFRAIGIEKYEIQRSMLALWRRRLAGGFGPR
jgi:ABC-type Fe3+-siderophore transport system permease subunit